MMLSLLPEKALEIIGLSFSKPKRGQTIWKVKWPIYDCQ